MCCLSLSGVLLRHVHFAAVRPLRPQEPLGMPGCLPAVLQLRGSHQRPSVSIHAQVAKVPEASKAVSDLNRRDLEALIRLRYTTLLKVRA